MNAANVLSKFFPESPIILVSMNQSSFRNSDRVTPNRPAEGRKFSSNFAVSRKRCSTKLLLLLDIDRKTYVVYGTTWSVMTLSVLGMVMSATANLWMVNAVKYSACVVYYCERRYMVFLRPFFKLACLVHKVLNTGHPPYLTELLQYHKYARSTHSSAMQSITFCSVTR